MKTISIGDLLNWILQNRQNSGAFKNWPEDAIKDRLLKACEDGELLIDVNNKGEIFGVALFHHVVHIEQVLTNQRFSFKTLMNSLFDKYPDRAALAMRGNKIVVYNDTKKVVQKINALG